MGGDLHGFAFHRHGLRVPRNDLFKGDIRNTGMDPCIRDDILVTSDALLWLPGQEKEYRMA